MNAINIFLVGLLGLSFNASAFNTAMSLEDWLQSQKQISIARMMQNISPAGTAPGTVIASPSKYTPNYYFHWIRDASLTIDQVVSLYVHEQDKSNSIYLQRIQEFIQLSELQQNEPGVQGFGEPRYLVTGAVDTTPWSRPQSDGPALRALTLMRFLKLLPGDHPLYPQTSKVIRRDLHYVMLNWQLPCFDLWEELKGLHFYTQAVQQTALSAGSEFFQYEEEFSNELASASQIVSLDLEKYWDAKNSLIGASRDLEQTNNSQYKISNLDSAVILAALHSNNLVGRNHSLFFSSHLDRFLSTAYLLELQFAKIYLVNSQTRAPAIGRFSDDIYFGGNPWYMTTLAFAEFYFKVALKIQNSEIIEITQLNLSFFKNALAMDRSLEPAVSLTEGEKIQNHSAKGKRLILSLQTRGNDFLETVRHYIGSQGEMSEQFDRQAGVPVSAPDLTWSYASFLSALHARDTLKIIGR